MKWILKRNSRFGVVLFLLLCFSFSAYGLDRELTAEERAQPATLTRGELADMFQELDNYESENSDLQTERDGWRTKYLESVEQRRTESENYNRKLMEFEQRVKLMEIESQVRTESLQRLESETVWTKLGIFGAGMCLGGWLDSQLRDWSEYNQSVKIAEDAGE